MKENHMTNPSLINVEVTT